MNGFNELEILHRMRQGLFGSISSMPTSQLNNGENTDNEKWSKQVHQGKVLNFARKTSEEDLLDSFWVEDGPDTNEKAMNASLEQLDQVGISTMDANSFLAATSPTPLDPSIGGAIPDSTDSVCGSSRTMPRSLQPSALRNLTSDKFRRNDLPLSTENNELVCTKEGSNDDKRKSATIQELANHNDSIDQCPIYVNQNNSLLLQSTSSPTPLSRKVTSEDNVSLSLDHAIMVDLQQKQHQDKKDKELSSQHQNNINNTSLSNMLNACAAASPSNRTDLIKELLLLPSFSTDSQEQECCLDNSFSVNVMTENNAITSMTMQDPNLTSSANKKCTTTNSKVKQKGPQDAFPRMMFQMLVDLEKEADGNTIASFLPHGNAFFIYNPDKFATHVMPKYFRTKVYASFQRQLNLYGFRRIKAGPDKGAYCHDLFIKGKYHLCTLIKRKRS